MRRIHLEATGPWHEFGNQEKDGLRIDEIVRAAKKKASPTAAGVFDISSIPSPFAGLEPFSSDHR